MTLPVPTGRHFNTHGNILPASVLNWTNFKPMRAHWLVGFPILLAFWCTFIHGGVHTRTHMYWGGASTTGGVPS